MLGSPLGHDGSRIARIAEVVERIDRMARNSPIWGLIYNVLAAVVWLI